MDFWLVLCLMPHPLAGVSDACSAPRSTVATLSTLQTSGPSPFPASCTLPLWVRILPLHKPAAVLWTNPINVGMGVVILYFQAKGYSDTNFINFIPIPAHFGIPYLSISVSLNVLLTLMIVIRLMLHGRNIRAATGSAAGISGLCKTVSTMLIESCALFAVSSLVVVAALVGTTGFDSSQTFYRGAYVVDMFFPILAEIQVRASSQPQSPGQLSNVTAGWAGDRSTAHCSTGRQPERVDEPHYRHWTRQFVQRQGARGTDGWRWYPFWWIWKELR